MKWRVWGAYLLTPSLITAEGVVWSRGAWEAQQVMSTSVAAIDTCTVAGVVFQLADREGDFQWLFPDGSRTGVIGASREEARRHMLSKAPELADVWKGKAAAALCS